MTNEEIGTEGICGMFVEDRLFPRIGFVRYRNLYRRRLGRQRSEACRGDGRIDFDRDLWENSTIGE